MRRRRRWIRIVSRGPPPIRVVRISPGLEDPAKKLALCAVAFVAYCRARLRYSSYAYRKRNGNHHRHPR